jgi:hypothetical protein
MYSHEKYGCFVKIKASFTKTYTYWRCNQPFSVELEQTSPQHVMMEQKILQKKEPAKARKNNVDKLILFRIILIWFIMYEKEN